MLRKSKYLYGSKDISVPANLNFGDFMLKNFWDYKDKTALINGITNELTKYGQLAQEATNLAVSLTHLGVKKGEVVAIMAENRKEYFGIFVGIACTGAVVTTLNYLYSEGEMKHILSISKPTYLICSLDAYKIQEKNIKSYNKFKQIIIIDDEKIPNTINYKNLATVSNESSLTSTESSSISKESSSSGEESSFIKNGFLTKNVKFDDMDAVSVNGKEDLLVILYSSGTTGLPKGVMLTHHNIITMCNASPIDFLDGPIMTIGPWFHAMGLVGVFGGLNQGKPFAFLPKFDFESMLKTVEKFKVDMLVLVPAVVVALTKSTAQFDLSSVRKALSGAAPIHKDTVQEFLEKFPNVEEFIQGYGMTECCLGTAKNRYAPGEVVPPGTVGKIIENMILKVVDPETQIPLGLNQVGEFCVKGETLMKGYVGKDPREYLDEEGFFKTGDVGYYDEKGFLFVVDRLKELIKYKGNQVAPAELEAILLQHQAVREAGVVGLQDKEAGELPLAFVALQPGKKTTEAEIQQFVADRVSNPKRLRGGVRFLDDIPKNPTGKIQRQVLRRMANSQKSKL